MSSGELADVFDAHYYATECGQPYLRNEIWLGFFGAVADRIASDVRPASVLDVGCAIGLLVECLRARGVQAFGLDISEYAIQNVHDPIKPYCRLGSATDEFPQRYDLITCIEVLEHMPSDLSERAVQNICRHTDDVLFSSTPFDYTEATHFNVQPPEYWAELFARQGFYRDVDFDASFLTAWAVRFRRRTEPVHRLVRDYERAYWLLRKENVDLRRGQMESRARLSQLACQLDGATAQTARENEQREFAMAALQAEHARLAAERGRLKAERARLAAEHGRLEAERGQFEAEHGQFEAEHGQFEAERGTPQALVNELERQLHLYEAWQAGLQATPGWRVLVALQRLRGRLFPPGSLRDRILRRSRLLG